MKSSATFSCKSGPIVTSLETRHSRIKSNFCQSVCDRISTDKEESYDVNEISENTETAPESSM